jgi:hypothetical protein
MDIANSPRFDALTLAQGRPLTSLSDIALATSDHGRFGHYRACFFFSS